MQIKQLNRDDLTSAEKDILDTKVLPTARRWLRIPGLAAHGAATLKAWGEPMVDDHGKPHKDRE